MNKSTPIKNQSIKKTYNNVEYQGEKVDIIVNIRYDDRCNNGHNSFSITADVYKASKARTGRNMICCGCCHDIIKECIPELSYLIKWHLCNVDAPMYYIENTVYHASKIEKYDNYVYLKDTEFDFNVLLGIYSDDDVIKLQNKYSKYLIHNERKPDGLNKEADIEATRSCAIWEDATLEQLQDKTALMARLPSLMKEFRQVIEGLGFIY